MAVSSSVQLQGCLAALLARYLKIHAKCTAAMLPERCGAGPLVDRLDDEQRREPRLGRDELYEKER